MVQGTDNIPSAETDVLVCTNSLAWRTRRHFNESKSASLLFDIETAAHRPHQLAIFTLLTTEDWLQSSFRAIADGTREG